MNKEQLNYFTLAYQTRNYSTAAKRVPMSSQGFSKSIHTLENELGVTLFTDENGSLTPTPYAEELLKFANNWDINYQMMKESFRRIRAIEKHEIRLGTSLGIIGFLGIDFLVDFQKEHSEINISYNETSDLYCEEGLRRGTYDLAFTLAPYESDFTTTEMFCTSAYFWVNKDNPLWDREYLTIEDLEGCDIGIPGEDFNIYRSVLSACKDQGVELGSVFTSAEIFWLYEFVADNKGISFTLPHLTKLSAFSKNERIVSLPLKNMIWRFGLSHLSSHQLAAHERTFIQYCTDQTKVLKSGVHI